MGKGGDVMGGHPFVAIAWLAAHSEKVGRPLRADDIILTGSLFVTQFPAVGERVEAEIDRLGSVSVQFD